MNEIKKTEAVAPVPAEPTPPIPGGGSWRLIENKWVPSQEVAEPAQQAEPQPTEE